MILIVAKIVILVHTIRRLDKFDLIDIFLNSVYECLQKR